MSRLWSCFRPIVLWALCLPLGLLLNLAVNLAISEATHVSRKISAPLINGDSVDIVGRSFWNGVAQEVVLNSASLLTDADGDYLETPDHADFDFTTSDATIEVDVRPTSMPAVAAILVGQSPNMSDGNWQIYIYNNGRVAVGLAGINEIVTGTGLVSAGVTNTIRITRTQSSGLTEIFTDNVLRASAATAVWNDSISTLRIGASNSTTYGFNGRMDNMLITKNGAEVLTLRFEGAQDSTTFIDSAPTPKTITASGNAKVDTSVAVIYPEDSPSPNPGACLSLAVDEVVIINSLFVPENMGTGDAGSVNYKYSCNNGSFSSWLTQAGIRTVANCTITTATNSVCAESRLISNGTQRVSHHAYALINTEVEDTGGGGTCPTSGQILNGIECDTGAATTIGNYVTVAPANVKKNVTYGPGLINTGAYRERIIH